MRTWVLVCTWVVLVTSAPIVGMMGGAAATDVASADGSANGIDATGGASADAVGNSDMDSEVGAQRLGSRIEQLDREGAVVEQQFRYELTPSRDDTIDVTMRFEATADLQDICINVPDSYTVVSKQGFTKSGGVQYTCPYYWTESTMTPSITFRVSSTQRNDRSVEYYEGESWGLTKFNSWNRYRVNGDENWYGIDDPSDSRTETTRVVADGGIAGDTMVYFGDVEVESWHVKNEEFRLVDPRGVSLDRNAIRESLVASARMLDIGGRGNRVTVFGARDPIRLGGRAWGDSAWVHQAMQINDPNNVWVHEYVHTRQKWRAAPEMVWVREASAEYYAALAAYRQGSVTFSAFYEHVSTDEDASVVLSDDDAADETRAEYTKGSRVVAALDRKIRLASDGNRTFEDVLYLMNRHDGQVTYTDFTNMVETVAGRSMDDWLDRFVTTEAVPGVAMDESWVTETPADRDADGDGLVEVEEKDRGLNPFDPDTDSDGLNDSAEVAGDTNPHVYDTDGDGLKDGREVEVGTDPTMYDTDTDGIDDETEVEDRRTDPTKYDTDGDGLNDGEEQDSESLDPLVADTDGDGLDDGEEVRAGTDPSAPDSDGDGVEDGREDELGTDPLVEDTDDDGLIDGDEVEVGTDPLESDTDGDGLDDAEEVNGATDPLDADSDGDGVDDGADSDPMASETTGSGGVLPGPMPGFGVGVSALAIVVVGAGIRRLRG